MILDDSYQYVINEKGEKVEAPLGSIRLCKTGMCDLWMPVGYTFTTVELTAEQVRSAHEKPIKLVSKMHPERVIYVERAIFSVIDQTIPFTGGGDFGIFFNQNDPPATRVSPAENILKGNPVQLDGVKADPKAIGNSAVYFTNLGVPFQGGDGVLKIELFHKEIE